MFDFFVMFLMQNIQRAQFLKFNELYKGGVYLHTLKFIKIFSSLFCSRAAVSNINDFIDILFQLKIW